jgi:hypothetical protein
MYAQDIVDIIAPFRSYAFDEEHFNGTYPYTYPIRSSVNSMSGPLGGAIGNATVASGRMIPEFTVNPANLAMTKYNMIHVGGLFNHYNGINQNSLGGISYISAVPVYSGSLSFGAGVTKERDYNLYYRNDDITQRTSGGLYNWRFTGAVEVQKDIFVGGELSLLSGKRNNNIAFSPADGFIEENNYFGITGRIGMNYHFLPILNAGVSIDLPTVLGVDYSLRNYSSSLGSTSYTITSPAILRAGLALTLRIVDLYYSIDYANWQNLTVRSSRLTQGDVDEINREIFDNFSVTYSHHVGMAIHVPLLPLHFYFGYQYLPDAYLGLNGFSLGKLIPRELDDRFSSSFSWGFSLFLKQGLSISASFETAHVFYDEEREKPRNTQLSLGYFF